MAEPSSEPETMPEAPPAAKKPWGKIAAVIVVLIVIIAAIAVFSIKANRPPVIEQAAASSTTAETGASLTFTAQASDPDGDPVTYTWDFGDGTTGTGASATHAYTLSGQYIALLTVTDGKGGSVTNDQNLLSVQVTLPSSATQAPGVCTSVTTCPAGPVVAVLTSTVSSATTGTSVHFNGNESWAYAFRWNDTANHSMGSTYELQTAASSASLFTSFVYAWGDGSTDTTGTSTAVGRTSHTFNSQGNIFVRLTVTYTHPDVTPTTVTGTAGFTVRVVAALPPEVVKYPDIFTTASFGEPDYLDPAVDYETAGGEVLQSVYETLIWYQEGSESVTILVPRLATDVPTTANGGISADGKNYTFTLRTGVQFHSGGNMTADDVVFSIQRVLAIHDPDGPSWILEQVLTNYVSYWYGNQCGPTGTLPCMIADYADGAFTSRADIPPNIRAVLLAAAPEAQWGATSLDQSLAWAISNSTVEATDSTHVVFHLTHPYPAFLQAMAYTIGSVVSEACILANGGVVWATHNTWLDGSGGCGTGPFKLKSWQRSQVIILERFDNYWRTPAALREVHLVNVQDITTREFMLKSGEADVVTIGRDHQFDVMSPAGTPLYSTIDIVKDKPTFTVLFFGYNQAINTAGTPDPWTMPADFFADVHVRKTFSYAFNYQNFIQNVIYGGGVQLRGPIPEGMFGYNPNVPLFTYDLTRAQAELQASPYWTSGFSITLYYNAGNTVREQGCLLLKQGLEAIPGAHGPISVSVRALDWPVYLAALRAKALPIFFLGWAPDYADPDDYVVPFLRTGGTFPNRVGYSNTTLDAWIDQAGAELNTAAREQLYFNITYAAVTSDVPYLWIYQATNFHVERSWVSGYYFNPMLSGLYYYTLSKG